MVVDVIIEKKRVFFRKKTLELFQIRAFFRTRKLPPGANPRNGASKSSTFTRFWSASSISLVGTDVEPSLITQPYIYIRYAHNSLGLDRNMMKCEIELETKFTVPFS